MKVTKYTHKLSQSFYITPAVVCEWAYTNTTNKRKLYTIGIEFARWGFYLDLVLGE